MIIVRWVTDKTVEVSDDGELGGIIGVYSRDCIQVLRDLAECDVIDVHEIELEEMPNE